MTFAVAGTLFAQAGGGRFGGGGGGAGAGPDEAMMVVILVAEVIALIVGIAVSILYYLTLSRALQQCSPRNRTMEPGQVWLNFIPCFNLVWIFITVSRIAESLSNEFHDRGMRSEGDYGRGLGITTYVLALCGIIPFIGPFISLGAMVCWIIYWVKIAGYSKQLREGESYRDDEDRAYRRDKDDRDDDDRPSKRSRRDDDEEEDDRPSKRRRRDDDEDEDDRPSKRRRRDDD